MAVQVTASHAILERLAAEGRRVLSPWRAAVLLRRATLEIPPHERRWQQFPQGPDDIAPLLRQMRARGEIRPIERHRQLFEVIVPYARQGFIDEREILFELHPYCAISHLSAMEFHGLTYQRPKRIFVTVSQDGYGACLPLGTESTDWEGIELPAPVQAGTVRGHPIAWKAIRPDAFFGHADYRPHPGYPMRYTTIERTLIDGITSPDQCGGFENVLSAWGLARDRINLEVIVSQIERVGTTVLHQRAGFILERLGFRHPRFAEWKAHAPRGGSSKLVAAVPYAPTFDEQWNLSINVPIDEILDEVA